MTTTPLPTRRSDLVIRPIGDGGRYVVKDPHGGGFFQIGEEERFLLEQLDGARDSEGICSAFEVEFGEPLSQRDLGGFLELAARQEMLDVGDGRHQIANGSVETSAPLPALSRPQPQPQRQSILYWRKRLFDPDALFNRLEPRVRFFWTRGFLLFSAACILFAGGLLWLNRYELATSLQAAVRWETLAVTWLVMLIVITLHEFAHGLTCKHYGGEVREIGFLLMFFMPCFYCNVSDAWLFREKSKRLWVTLAGGYFQLFLWALAVMVWRVTAFDSLINYLAFLVIFASGAQTLFNFNPLLKLDGYYLLSDWMEIPNLRQRSLDYAMSRARRLLWGAAPPESEPRARFLLGYGLTCWVYSVSFLGLMLFAMSRFAGSRWGPIGFGAVVILGALSIRGLFKGISEGEAMAMIVTRHNRSLVWLAGLGTIAAALFLVEIDDRAGGPCVIRSACRADVRAPVAGFISELLVDEGDSVNPGTPLARMEVPGLDSRLRQKQAEVREAEAGLRLLELGTRPEQIAEQRREVERMQSWCDLARRDLSQLQRALAQDLNRLDECIVECRAELDGAHADLERSESLFSSQALSADRLQDSQRLVGVWRARLAQAESEREVRQAQGTLEAESELARREKELEDSRSELTLLESGSRPDEIDAARARLCRLDEEVRFLEQTRQQLLIVSSITGVVSTPRLTESAGRHLKEGALILSVEDPTLLSVEISLSEDAIERICVDQPVRLKARGCPFEMFHTRVDSIAPVIGAIVEESHARPETGSETATVYCQMEAAALRPGMTGYARISTGRRSIAGTLGDRALGYLRTEFWW